MDRHDLKSVTAKDVAEAHRQDLKIQDQFQCKGLTYWFDEERGTAFCLIEAPDENCVKEMHDHAHGLVPHQIIEVDKNVVSAFLGRIEDPKSTKFLEDNHTPIINESAYRSIMCVCIENLSILRLQHGNHESAGIMSAAGELIKRAVEKNSGREVGQSGDYFVVSFTSARNALRCVREMKDRFNAPIEKSQSRELQLNVGLSFGSPVTGQHDLFGEAVQTSRWLCALADGNKVVVSSEINDLLVAEGINGLRRELSVEALAPSDELFLKRFAAITEAAWYEPALDIDTYCREIGMSRSQFYRKTTSLTGHSPNDFLRTYRLKKALELLEKRHDTISEVAFKTGFNSPSYFSKCFKKKYGALPSALLEQ